MKGKVKQFLKVNAQCRWAGEIAHSYIQTGMNFLEGSLEMWVKSVQPSHNTLKLPLSNQNAIYICMYICKNAHFGLIYDSKNLEVTCMFENREVINSINYFFLHKTVNHTDIESDIIDGSWAGIYSRYIKWEHRLTRRIQNF